MTANARVGHAWAALLALSLLLLSPVGLAQGDLIVNGRGLGANLTTVVPGVSYASGAPLAEALGGTFVVDGAAGVVAVVSGGRVLQLTIVDDPAEATTPGAVWLDGRQIADTAAVRLAGEVYLPVKVVAEALGASVAYLSEENAVMVVQPRGRLTAMRRAEGAPERLELRVSSPVRYSLYYNEPLSSLEIRFERTDMDVRLPPVSGSAFTLATAVSGGGATDVRVQLDTGTQYDVYAVPDGRGFLLTVALRKGTAPAVATQAFRFVVDPGHGGPDEGIVTPNVGSEAELALRLGERLRSALEGRGYTATLTRDTDTEVGVLERSAEGVGADLFVSVHAGDLPIGTFRAYYLDDAASVASLEMAVRENASAEARSVGTDALRRRLLLGLVPDLDVGRRAAEAVAARLFNLGGYRAESVGGAPLQVLGGAAGRGILLEFSAADLASDGLPARLGEALAQLVEGGVLVAAGAGAAAP